MKSLALKLVRLGIAMAASCAALPALAAYPERPVHIIVSVPAGGSMDAASRIVGEKLSALWGQTVVVENKPGASGRVATGVVAKSPPDGYTVIALANSAISDEVLRPDTQARPSRDLAPVARVFSTPAVLLAHKSLGIETLAQYINLARTKPGTLSFGSSGEGTSTHFFGELLKHEAGIDIIHVPYAGEGPNLNDLMAGHLSSSFVSAMGARKADQSDRVRMLAVATMERSPLLPNVPSFAELGYRGIDMESWAGFFVPVGTPPAVIEKIAVDVQKVLAMSDVGERFNAIGLVPAGESPHELGRRVESDKAYWTKAIKDTGIKVK